MPKAADFEEEEQDAGTGSLVRSYGEYWSREAVDWDSGKIKGHRRHYKANSKNLNKKVRECDIWKQRGIYALYKDFALVYVGLASSAEGVGGRLKWHTEKPRTRDRWDSFSWFGIDSYDAEGQLQPASDQFSVSAPDLARTLELVAILVANPPLNRARGRFMDAERIEQATERKGKKTANKLLSEIEALVAEVRKLSRR